MNNQSFMRKWGSLIVLSLALAIIIIDTTILNVSLSTIIKDLHTDIQSIQWVITIYSLILAAFTITGGRLGDFFGRKKMFMFGAAIFAVGSFVASISHHLAPLLIGEAVIEGFGAALMMPATASLLVANFRGRDRAVAFGIWGGIAAASAAIGPIIGGFLTTHYTWRWAFRINVFIAAILIIGSILIKESRDEAEKPEIDFPGVIL
jgi:MFS family permease